MALKKWLTGETRSTLVCAIVSAAALVCSLAGWLRAAPVDAAWAAIVLCGLPIVYGAARGLILDHSVKADLLVSLALIASVSIGEYFAAGEVALIMQIGTLLEDYTAEKARRGIGKLIALAPQTARVRREGLTAVIPADELRVGDVVTVLAGETVPADGVIVSGETAIDQSVMTGESVPVDKKAGDAVASGTVNQFGTFDMRADKVCGDSSLQRMIRLARQADANKAPIVGLADRWATWMVLGAAVIAALTWLISGEFIRAVTVLVVFCPCAFVLATPTAIMAGIGNAAGHGVLIRSGEALERLAGIRRVAFDKTGTLTRGQPDVIGAASFDARYSEAELLRLAALAEQRSEHPLGRAIVACYVRGGGKLTEISDFQMTAGQGVRARAEGQLVAAGRWELAAGTAMPANAQALAASYRARGATVIFLSVDGAPAGLLALADTVRPDAAEAVSRLKRAGLAPVLLTGDNERAARTVAEQVGLEDVRAGLLPEDKLAAMRDYDARNEPVCMVGDGVNDALALAAAYASVAMGGIGSAIAVESADAVLTDDSLLRLPYLFRLARRTMGKVRQNLLISLGINLAAVTLSVLGLLNPVTGALMHNCGSVLVVLNAALLLRERKSDYGCCAAIRSASSDR